MSALWIRTSEEKSGQRRKVEGRGGLSGRVYVRGRDCKGWKEEMSPEGRFGASDFEGR